MGDRKLSRKEFFTIAARYGIAALLVLLAGFLVTKRNINNEEVCTNDKRCGSCNKRSSCTIDNDK